jgi:hypothetical protein
VVVWQLGGEPFSAAALGWGERFDDLHTTVAGEPRNRDLAFRALLEFARWFNPRFEAAATERERCDWLANGLARSAPQVVVANGATAAALGQLGRRLAYLPDAEAALVRLGRHLLFLADRWHAPGQQLLVVLTDLLGDHWVTPQPDGERQHLAAFDAWIDPPAGVHGLDAATTAEEVAIGPVPPGDLDERLHPLVERFNRRRAGRTEPAAVGPLLGEIERHFRPLVGGTWRLLWRCRDREAALPEAPSVGRRWDADRTAYTRHIDWLDAGGRRRTRDTARRAVQCVREQEEARRLLEAEEVTDDPVRMVGAVLEGKAVRGRVVGVDREYREVAVRRSVRRPLVTLESPDPCPLPPGTEVWWADRRDERGFAIHAASAISSGGWRVVLKLLTGTPGAGLPAVGTVAAFSVHHTRSGYRARYPEDTPWTHTAPGPAAGARPIEE